MRIITSLFLFLITSSWALAQGTDLILQQAREEITILTSEEFAGRGYVNDGHLKAAEFIAGRMEEAGLTPIKKTLRRGRSWFQPFQFSALIVKDGSLTIDGDSLAIGPDFIVNKYSASGNVSGKVVDLGYGLKARKFPKAAGKIVVFRSGWPEKLADDAEAKDELSDLAGEMDRVAAIAKENPLAIIILKSKLTHGFVAAQAGVPILEVLDESWPRRCPRVAEVMAEASPERVNTQNVLGFLPGTCESDETVVICAHYDHLGQVGDAIFTGANDNAAGVTMMLSMMDHFVQPENRPERNILFIGFSAEEVGLLGSRYYVAEDPIVRLSDMEFLLNLDLMGNGVDGIMAVGGRTYPEEWEDLVALNDSLEAVPKVRARPNAPNSDHYWFLEEGVKGFFIYTMGGPSWYHDVFDTESNIELSRYAEVRELLIQYLEEYHLDCAN